MLYKFKDFIMNSKANTGNDTITIISEFALCAFSIHKNSLQDKDFNQQKANAKTQTGNGPANRCLRVPSRIQIHTSLSFPFTCRLKAIETIMSQL